MPLYGLSNVFALPDQTLDLDEVLGVKGEESSYTALDDLGNNDLDSPGSQRPQKKSKRGLLWGSFILLFCLTGAAGGVYFFAPELFSSAGPTPLVPPQKVQEELIPTEQLKKMTLRNVRQYTISNEKIGRVTVIEGKVVNGFSTPKDLIKVEALLFDETGQTIRSKQQFCGVTASLFQLQVLSEKELDLVMGNKIEVLTNNTSILPDAEVSFMVVFYNPPETVHEFLVKVVEVKDPPEGP